MTPICRTLLVLAILVLPATAGAAPQTFKSGTARVNLLELYTSEGCSSCPPAEEWLSALRLDPRLWTQVIPVAFHVDYWDSAAWRDRFDSRAYTRLQQRWAQYSGQTVVYTPEFVLDGHPWTDWFGDRPLTLPRTIDAGRLTLIIDGREVRAAFAPVNDHYKLLELHVAVLAFGVTTQVNGGENSGRELRHDFLVIAYVRHPFTRVPSGFTADLVLPHNRRVRASRYALAAWVGKRGDSVALQGTGGWLSTPLETHQARTLSGGSALHPD